MNVCDRLKASGACAFSGAVAGAVSAAVGGALIGLSTEEMETVIVVSAAANAVFGAAYGFCQESVLSNESKRAIYVIAQLGNTDVAPCLVATAIDIGVSPAKVITANSVGIAVGVFAGVAAAGVYSFVDTTLWFCGVDCHRGQVSPV